MVLPERTLESRLKPFSDCIPVLGETWTRLLSQAAAGMTLAVVVPVPLNASVAGRGSVHLRNAIAKVNDGDYEERSAQRARPSMPGAMAGRPRPR